MKHKVFFLLLLILVSSCSVTKRRYMPGYSINWGHKATKTVLNNGAKAKPFIDNEKSNNNYSNKPIVSASINNENRFQPSKQISGGNVTETQINNTDSKLNSDSQVNTIPDHPQNSQEVCKESKRSLRFGILTLGIPTIAILLFLALAAANPATGGAFASGGEIFGFIIILFAILAAVVMLILALVYGIVALHKIHKEPEKYRGTWKAIIGMILALGLAWIPLLLWLINTLINQ